MKTYSKSLFFKRILDKEYNRRCREKNPEKYREYSRNWIRKWRKSNPELSKELNKKYQLTWRLKNPELNRQRAKHGLRARKMYNDLIKFAKV